MITDNLQLSIVRGGRWPRENDNPCVCIRASNDVKFRAKSKTFPSGSAPPSFFLKTILFAPSPDQSSSCLEREKLYDAWPALLVLTQSLLRTVTIFDSVAFIKTLPVIVYTSSLQSQQRELIFSWGCRFPSSNLMWFSDINES